MLLNIKSYTFVILHALVTISVCLSAINVICAPITTDCVMVLNHHSTRRQKRK